MASVGQMASFAIGFAVGVLITGLCSYLRWHGRRLVQASAGAEEKHAALPVQEPTIVDEEAKASIDTFAVERRPRRVPWHLKRRELEAQHRTRRKAREEFREI